jgi:predicted phosphodiesterase
MGPVAVLSDIHGVRSALAAVLAEPGVRAAELVVVTGDIAAGPQPSEVLDLPLGLGDRVLLVRGNADRELVELVDVRTVVCGHTHMPFVRLADRRPVINPGSVGMPYGGAGAHWALLDDGAVTLRTTGFDTEAARASIAATSGYPDVHAFVDEYLTTPASDFDALAAFGPRDARATGGRP